MADKAHQKTDKKILKMEQHLSAIYSDAEKEIAKKAEKYFAQFQKADDEKRKLVEAGKLTEAEYKEWRQGKIMYGTRFTALKKNISEELLHVNETATAYINGELPEVYANNYNAIGNTVNGVGGYSFTMVDRNTVKYLATTDSSLLPTRKLDPTKDIAWNMKKINTQVLQGIIQGESIPKITKRIENVQKMNKEAAVRSARTIVTGAENKGRMDGFKRAQDDGIILEREWIATKDSRTRDWHGELDGVTKPIDEPFENEFGKIMYPGDPTAHGANVYNCRCTLGAVVKGFRSVNGSKNSVESVGKSVDSAENSGIINNRGLAMGLRQPATHVLTKEEIDSVRKDAEKIEIPLEILRFNTGRKTGFSDDDGWIGICGDILPDTNSSIVRDRMSQRAVLAHEYYGHYKNHPSEYEIGDWRDEFRASYDAAVKTPNLSAEDRAYLMIDAYDRAKEAGELLEYDEIARGIIYGY